MFKIDPEVLELTKNDLPEDAKPIVDEVAMQTEKLAQDLFQQFSKTLAQREQAFDELLAKNAEQVQQNVDVLVTEVGESYSAMQVTIAEISKAISAYKNQVDQQAGATLDIQTLEQKSKQLESVVTEQRKNLETVRKGIAGSVAKLVKTNIPFPL